MKSHTVAELAKAVLATLDELLLYSSGDDELACAIAGERQRWERLARSEPVSEGTKAGDLVELVTQVKAEVERVIPQAPLKMIIQVRDLLGDAESVCWDHYDRWLLGERGQSQELRKEEVAG